MHPVPTSLTSTHDEDVAAPVARSDGPILAEAGVVLEEDVETMDLVAFEDDDLLIMYVGLRLHAGEDGFDHREPLSRVIIDVDWDCAGHKAVDSVKMATNRFGLSDK